MATTISIEDNTWEFLNKIKKRGESFNEVVLRLLKISKIADYIKSGNEDEPRSNN